MNFQFLLLASLIASAVPARALDAAQLTGKLAGRDVVLTWIPAATKAAGHVVEYVNHPTDEWVILSFVPASRNTYTHPRLAPGTPYAYRVRAFGGPASAPVDVEVASGLSDEAYLRAYAQPEDYSWAPPRKVASAGSGVLASRSLRRATDAQHAAPADLKVELMTTTVSGFRLTWTDRSSDEEGFLLERVESPHDFTVCAVVEPDTNTFGWALEPPARRGVFRVRAYLLGTSSNIVRFTTPADPDEETARAPAAQKPPNAGSS